MESTDIYWKPVYNILEGYFDVTLANAQRIKNVPVPGVSEVTAAVIISEIGVDMDQFPSAEHLSSWAGVAPEIMKVLVKKSTKSVKGNIHAKVALSEAAWAIARSRNTELSTKFWKIASRRGKKKACIAMGTKNSSHLLPYSKDQATLY